MLWRDTGNNSGRQDHTATYPETPKTARTLRKSCLQQVFRKVNEYDKEGMTPLILACYYGNMSMLNFLLKHGADPNKSHRDALLRAGHFISLETDWDWDSSCLGRIKEN